MKAKIEYTDTFGGDANYSWVRRAEIENAEKLTDRQIVRRAKAEMGLTGVPCKRHSFGDMIELRPESECTVLFINFS